MMGVERRAPRPPTTDPSLALRSANPRAERPKTQAEFAIYAGQVYLGAVVQAGADFTAFTASDDRQLGIYDTLKQAADAVDAAYVGER